MDLQERERLALSDSTSKDTLERLAGDEDWGVRHNVAKNPNTPTDALHRLAAEDSVLSVSAAAEEALSQRREDALGW